MVNGGLWKATILGSKSQILSRLKLHRLRWFTWCCTDCWIILTSMTAAKACLIQSLLMLATTNAHSEPCKLDKRLGFQYLHAEIDAPLCHTCWLLQSLWGVVLLIFISFQVTMASARQEITMLDMRGTTGAAKTRQNSSHTVRGYAVSYRWRQELLIKSYCFLNLLSIVGQGREYWQWLSSTWIDGFWFRGGAFRRGRTETSGPSICTFYQCTTAGSHCLG